MLLLAVGCSVIGPPAGRYRPLRRHRLPVLDAQIRQPAATVVLPQRVSLRRHGDRTGNQRTGTGRATGVPGRSEAFCVARVR